MFENDYIMRQIQMLSGFLAKVIFQKDMSSFDIINENGNISDCGLLYCRLKSLVSELKINEAENILFDAFQKNPTDQYLQIAVEFYKDVHDLSDDDLEKANFKHQEIVDGIETIRKIYVDHQIQPDE